MPGLCMCMSIWIDDAMLSKTKEILLLLSFWLEAGRGRKICMSTSPEFRLTVHAVEQYRDRVIACPERARDIDDLRQPIMRQLSEQLASKVRGADVVALGPWMFVIDGGSVVTTLGFMMMPKRVRAQ